MGLSVQNVHIITALIEHHLLLPDIATKGSISDDSTVAYVANRVGDVMSLQLQNALTEADALATSPTAWGT